MLKLGTYVLETLTSSSNASKRCVEGVAVDVVEDISKGQASGSKIQSSA